MMTKLLKIMFLLFCISFFNVAEATLSHTIKYKIQYDIKPIAQLKINVSFLTGPEEKTLIYIPTEGIKHLVVTANNIPTKILKNSSDPTHHTGYVLHPPNSQITISYTVTQVFKDLNLATLWHAIINSKYFYFQGAHVLIWPEQAQKNFPIEFSWNLPFNVKFFNSFGVDQHIQKATLNSLNQLKQSLFLGGDFRLYPTEQANHQMVYTVIRGKWPFDERDYTKHLNATIAVINKFWPKGHPEIFLNALIPVKSLNLPGRTSFVERGGHELYNSFVMMSVVPTSEQVKQTAELWETYKELIAHEYNHHWLPTILIRVPDDDLGGKWLSEGINEYLAQKIRLHAKDMTLTVYMKRCNKILASYFTTPVFGKNIDFGTFPVFNSENIFSIRDPYFRGELLAWYWSNVRKNFYPIDSALLNIAQEVPSKPLVYTDKLIVKYLQKAGLKNALQDIKTYARNGKEIPLNGQEFQPYFTSKKIPMLRYDIGFDLEKSKAENKIIGLAPEGPAAHAGIKEGTRFTNLTYEYGNPSVPVTVSFNNTSISYLPKKSVMVLQFVLKPRSGRLIQKGLSHFTGLNMAIK